MKFQLLAAALPLAAALVAAAPTPSPEASINVEPRAEADDLYDGWVKKRLITSPPPICPTIDGTTDNYCPPKLEKRDVELDPTYQGEGLWWKGPKAKRGDESTADVTWVAGPWGENSPGGPGGPPKNVKRGDETTTDDSYIYTWRYGGSGHPPQKEKRGYESTANVA